MIGEDKISNVMSKANISWKQLEVSLDILVNQDLVEIKRDNGSKSYVATEKGRQAYLYYLKSMGKKKRLTKHRIY
jgi:predicted transcriptional regulator